MSCSSWAASYLVSLHSSSFASLIHSPQNRQKGQANLVRSLLHWKHFDGLLVLLKPNHLVGHTRSLWFSPCHSPGFMAYQHPSSSHPTQLPQEAALYASVSGARGTLLHSRWALQPEHSSPHLWFVCQGLTSNVTSSGKSCLIYPIWVRCLYLLG